MGLIPYFARMNAAYSKVGLGGGYQSESLINDSFGSDGSARQTSKTTITLANAPTKIMAAAETVMGEALRRIKDDGIVGLFEMKNTRQTPPMVIELRSRVEVEGEAGEYIGIYLREKREVTRWGRDRRRMGGGTGGGAGGGAGGVGRRWLAIESHRRQCATRAH